MYPDEFYLSKDCLRQVVDVLNSLQANIISDFAIVGSLSHRYLLPDWGKSVRDKLLHDIDIILLPKGNQNPKQLVLPTIKDGFCITAIDPSAKGYYFGMIHKNTKIWTDIFMPFYSGKLASIAINGKYYQTVVIEDGLLWRVYDILWRKQKPSMRIEKKWIDTVKRLRNRKEIDHQLLQDLFESHRPFVLENLGVNLRESNIEELLDRVEKIPPTPKMLVKFPPDGMKFPSDGVTTENGISVDNQETLTKFFFSQKKNSR
jgi:hypothetical protein